MRTILVAAIALAVAPATAMGHLVTTGLGPFYDGALHLALSPDDLLGLLAIALLAGLGGPKAGRLTILLLPAAWLVGGMIGNALSGVPDLPGISILSFAVLGALVALDPKLPPSAVAALAGIYGVLHGVLNGSALGRIGQGGLPLLGIVLTVSIVTLLVAAAVVSLRASWTRIAVRVAGSWVAAVGMLMFGWIMRGAV